MLSPAKPYLSVSRRASSLKWLGICYLVNVGEVSLRIAWQQLFHYHLFELFSDIDNIFSRGCVLFHSDVCFYFSHTQKSVPVMRAIAEILFKIKSDFLKEAYSECFIYNQSQNE